MASRNNQLFNKRKAKKRKELARRRATLAERRRVLIICEGEKTEPNYLRAMVTNLSLTTADVQVCGEGGSAPKSVVQFGINKLKSDPDFELIFFVFDRDNHADYNDALILVERLKKKNLYKEKKIEAITSVPCFEIWFLLHFERHIRPYEAGGGKSPCGNLISVLKKQPEFIGYGKGTGNHFEMLRGRLKQAKKYSAHTFKQSRDSGEAKHHGNPTTLMHTLVDALEKVAEESRRK